MERRVKRKNEKWKPGKRQKRRKMKESKEMMTE